MAAIDRLPRTRVGRRSSLYRSRPMGVVSQASFINAVVRVDTRLTAPELLLELHGIERRFGRVRRLRWGPRTVDLDILVYGDRTMNRRDLIIPHPGMASRLFVLYPLVEIAPGLHIPGRGTALSVLRRCRGPVPTRLRSGDMAL